MYPLNLVIVVIVFVTKICNGGRISYILNFFLNLSAMKSKLDTFKLLNNKLQTTTAL